MATMYSSERPQVPQRQSLPSLQQILAPENHSDLPSPYTPRTQQSSAIPPFRSLESPRDTALPSLRGPSTYYQSYQAPPPPPPPTIPLGHDGRDQRYQASSHPALPLRDSQYSLSSGSAGDRPPLLNQGRQPYPSQQPPEPLGLGGSQRRPSLIPSQQAATAAYPSPQPSIGLPPRAPRVVDEQYIAGEGLCYVYDDGTRCQKYIDGENVNPQWGVTKAGKPRKRLAQACTTCREKKIKCDPSSPKCLQCQKFNRECRFENAPRGHHHLSSNFTPNIARPGVHEQLGPNTPATARESVSSHGSIKRSAEEERLAPIHGRPALELQDENEVKKQRRGSASYSPEPRQQASKNFKGKLNTLNSPDSPITGFLDVDGPRMVEWRTDPWEIDPESANYHMNLYFDHVNSANYGMFPRKQFMSWCQNCRSKSADDGMVVYSLLALGAVFSNKPDRHTILKKYLSIAEYAVLNSFGRFSLQLVQARVALGLLHFSTGNTSKAWDFCGSAIRVALGLRLNMEEGITNIADDQGLEYGLSRNAFEECQRRTFWSVFLLDRFNGYTSSHSSIISADDCYLRLPMSDSSFENESRSSAPFFFNTTIDPILCDITQNPSSLGSMAHLINIVHLWGDSLAFICHSNYRAAQSFPQQYEAHHHTITTSLAQWESSLPSHLTWSAKNLDQSIRHGYIGNYISIHSLYHSMILQLHRYLRWRTLPPSSPVLLRNIRVAYEHARSFLAAIGSLAKIDRDARLGPSPDAPFVFSTPLTGYAILTAIDILSAGGALTDLSETIRLIDSGLEVVEELASFWNSAKVQYRLIIPRLNVLAETLAEHGPKSPRVGEDTRMEGQENGGNPSKIDKEEKIAWILDHPLSTKFNVEDDLVYSMDRVEYLRGIGVESLGSMAGVVVVEGRGGVSTEAGVKEETLYPHEYL